MQIRAGSHNSKYKMAAVSSTLTKRALIQIAFKKITSQIPHPFHSRLPALTLHRASSFQTSEPSSRPPLPTSLHLACSVLSNNQTFQSQPLQASSHQRKSKIRRNKSWKLVILNYLTLLTDAATKISSTWKVWIALSIRTKRSKPSWKDLEIPIRLLTFKPRKILTKTNIANQAQTFQLRLSDQNEP